MNQDDQVEKLMKMLGMTDTPQDTPQDNPFAKISREAKDIREKLEKRGSK